MTKIGWRLRNRRLVASPPVENPKWVSHAQAPVVMPVSNGLWRIYVSGRCARNISRVFALDLSAHDLQVVRIHPDPVLDIGAPDAFDAHGVGAGSIIRNGDQVFLYYTGLKQQDDVPYRIAIGLAVSDDDGLSFRRLSDQPVLGWGPRNPLGTTTGTVYRHKDQWEMWYSSIRDWRKDAAAPDPVYDLRRAWSRDGIDWTAEATATVGLDDLADGSGGLIRPNVCDGPNGPQVIFAERGWRQFRAGQGAGYQLAVAAPGPDGAECPWLRVPNAIVADPPRGADDWDSDMQCYPWLVQTEDRRLLFYCGNDFGKFGFGVADLVQSEGAR